ncbi:hypothetical protein [Pedobacter sp. SYP-B3415]|uniref:hypothetical protein n=1 Tax=Pedobacter sp. SYP-B3415 TaxID=2496641 RepID=UPI00101B694C|nr:hypothetical protein [Pedobacter sp. SYP-B3415]
MLRKILFLFLMAGGLAAQAQHNPDDLIESANWDVIGGVDFKTPNDNEMYAVYNANIKKYENKPFELYGYIVPIKDGMKQQKFMLSTLPINQCFYCGKNGVPIMVMVELTEAVKFTYKPVTVKGILKLNKGNAMDGPPIVLAAAKSI